MMPYWLFALKTLAACGIGGGIICGLFALGMKHGIDGGFKSSNLDTVIVDELGKKVEGLTDKNSEAHGRLWDKLGEHDEQLFDHDKRLTVIEKGAVK